MGKHPLRRVSLLLAGSAAAAAVLASPASAFEPISTAALDRAASIGILAPANGPGVGTTGGGPACTTTGVPTADIDISCDDPIAPDNELAIVADPENPNHLLAGSNDYQLNFVGNSAVVRVPVGFFVSFDGGTTWTDGAVPLGDGTYGTGDPSPAFNAKYDTAHMASLAFVCGQRSDICTRGDVQVATSYDGGLHWQRPVTAAKGHGSDNSARQLFNDKEWLTADNNPDSPFYGRLYLVWAAFSVSKADYQSSGVFFSYSDDAGKTWSTPGEISGRNPTYCTFQSAPGGDPFACDEDEFAYTAVASDGTLYVHFFNQQNEAAWEPGDLTENVTENQIMVVKSTDGGATWSNPVHVVQLEDGSADYPFNVDGVPTLTGHQLRVNAAGNIDVDPVTGRVAIVFADNAAGTHDTADPVTDVNVYVAYSDDGGSTWVGGDSGQTDLATRLVVDGRAASDQWYPWAAFDPTDGELKVLYMDGRTDRDLYDISLANSANGAPPFTTAIISQQTSNPDQDLWFPAGVPQCENCSVFIGDYNGLDVDTLGRAHGVWTDMRREVVAGLRTQDAFYARRP
jgi:hypothetical protein